MRTFFILALTVAGTAAITGDALAFGKGRSTLECCGGYGIGGSAYIVSRDVLAEPPKADYGTLYGAPYYPNGGVYPSGYNPTFYPGNGIIPAPGIVVQREMAAPPRPVPEKGK
jgi:hypothetical protein